VTTGLATIEAAGVAIDHDAVLKHLKLNPRDPGTQALLLVCDRYGLDPLLKHMVLITGNPYVTRDGLLAVAHRSGQFDGMEVIDQGVDDTHYFAKVAVYRRDMGHPFVYVGRFPKAKQMAKEYGPEMAVKCAEVQALRRAFNVTGIGAADERWDDEAMPERPKALPPHDPATGEILAAQPTPIGAPPAKVATKRPPPVPKKDTTLADAIADPTVKLLVADLNSIEDPELRAEAKKEFVARFGKPEDLKEADYDEARRFVTDIVSPF